MSSRNYSIIEPHPNIPQTQHYISTGRGGAGNAIRSPQSITRGSDATGPAAAAAIRASLSSSQSSQLSAKAHSVSSSSSSRGSGKAVGGRGGAGNVYPVSERAIFSFDEELERQLRMDRDVAPVYHVGRGGAGNRMVSSSSSRQTGGLFGEKGMGISRRMSEESGSSAGSDGSRASESGADVFNRGLKMGWKKIVGY